MSKAGDALAGDALAGDTVYGQIERALEPHGLILRGGLHLVESERLEQAAGAHPAFRTIILVGHVGSSFWPAFDPFRKDHQGPDPLDAWSRSVAEPIADRFGCNALYPFEKPWLPFQSWIKAVEGLQPSPLGILIHPRFGLWHGYRAAFGFEQTVAVPPPETLPHACDTCSDKPCLSPCPVDAVRAQRFDLQGCRRHLAGPEGQAGCLQSGCLARNACPVGAGYRYNVDQIRFHMQALELPSAPDKKSFSSASSP
ncbi:MAG: ferredoxin [Rhizobiaceae bacterium]|nr:ferredoxin [Rhizobiaceae bacterium]